MKKIIELKYIDKIEDFEEGKGYGIPYAKQLSDKFNELIDNQNKISESLSEVVNFIKTAYKK